MQRSSGPFRNLMRMHLGLLKVGQRRVTLHQLQWHVGAHNYGLYLQHTLQLAQSSIADFCNVSQTSLVHSITRTSGISQKYSLAVRIEAVLALCRQAQQWASWIDMHMLVHPHEHHIKSKPRQEVPV